MFIEKSNNTKWYIESNCNHVKLFMSVDKDGKLEKSVHKILKGKAENCMRAIGLQIFYFFQKILFAGALSFQVGERRI